MHLAFSLPVHENNDVVEDLLENVLRHNPGSLVILHVSKIFSDFDEQRFRHRVNIYINPVRYLTEYGRGLMHVHCSNFSALLSAGAEFDTFCILSSNELFVRPGLADYVAAHRNGFQAVLAEHGPQWHVFRRRLEEHPRMRALLGLLGTTKIYGGQTEGQFYERRVFDRICAIYRGAFGELEIESFETEEVIPQTVAMALGVEAALPFALVDYSHPEIRLSVPLLERLLDPTHEVLLNLGLPGVAMLESPHLNQDMSSVFTVKRVPRELQNPVRAYLRQARSPSLPRAQHQARVPLIPYLSWRKVTRRIKRLLQLLMGRR